jgi:hypothetical protein
MDDTSSSSINDEEDEMLQYRRIRLRRIKNAENRIRKAKDITGSLTSTLQMIDRIMIEVAAVNSRTDSQHGPSPHDIYNHHSPVSRDGHSFALENVFIEDVGSVIRCFCDFNSDDGNTVLCEDCNTWQHIRCYYSEGSDNVPDTHICVICKPRAVKREGAKECQRQARLLLSAGGGNVKRPRT